MRGRGRGGAARLRVPTLTGRDRHRVRGIAAENGSGAKHPGARTARLVGGAVLAASAFRLVRAAPRAATLRASDRRLRTAWTLIPGVAGADPPRLRARIGGDTPAALPPVVLVIAHHVEDILPRLAMPVRVVRGSRDRVVPQRWAAIVARLTGAPRPAVIPHWGHALHYHDPEGVARVVLDLARTLAARPHGGRGAERSGVDLPPTLTAPGGPRGDRRFRPARARALRPSTAASC